MHPMILAAFQEELTKISAARGNPILNMLSKRAGAPPLLQGMKGPDLKTRSLLGAVQKKLPGAIAGKSVAGDLTSIKGPQMKIQSLVQ